MRAENTPKIIYQHSKARAGGQAGGGKLRTGCDIARADAVWQDAGMSPMKPKKKLSKFGKAALEVAADIANLPLDGTKEVVRTVHEIESKRQNRKRTTKPSAGAKRTSE